jgi:hypothetical protein
MAAERFSGSLSAISPIPSPRILRLKDGYSLTDYMRELMACGRLLLGCEGGESHIRSVIEYFHCSPFMYSSDFPHEVGIESCRREILELEKLAISDLAKQTLRGDNARRFYRRE